MHLGYWVFILALITFLSIGVFGMALVLIWCFIATIPMGLHSLHRFLLYFVLYTFPFL